MDVDLLEIEFDRIVAYMHDHSDEPVKLAAALMKIGILCNRS